MKSKIEKWYRICPQCKSKEVTHRGMISREAYSNNWICLTCGFQGPIFPEINLEEYKKLPDKQKNFIPSRLPIFADRTSIPKWSRILFFIIKR